MSRDQDAGGSQSIKVNNSFFERVEELKYLRTTLTNENSMEEDKKSRLKQGMLAVIRRRIFLFKFAIQKFTD